MKKLLLLGAVLAALLSPSLAPAKDKKDKSDDYWKKEDKQTRDDLNEVQKHYSRVRDQLRNNVNADRSDAERLQSIGTEIDRMGSYYGRGSYDSRALRGRIHQLEDALTRLSADLQNRKSRGGYYDSKRRRY